MSPKTIFHLAILFSIILNSVALVLDVFFGMYMPDGLVSYDQYLFEKELPEIDVFLMWPTLIWHAIATIGIVFFYSWARILYVCYFVFYILYSPIVYGFVAPSSEYIIHSEWGEYLFYYSHVLEGVILTMLFYGPIANKFELRKANKQINKD